MTETVALGDYMLLTACVRSASPLHTFTVLKLCHSNMSFFFQSDLTWPLWVWYYIVAVSTGALKGIISF